jgi:hypothetical protein
MNKNKCTLVLIIPMFLIGCARDTSGARADTNDGVDTPTINLALGRPYEFTIRPSYALCTDEDDRTQLTDGQTHGCDWKQKTTVGWGREDQAPGVIIDLGTIQPIEAVRVYSIGGGRANVFYPHYILVFVSDNGEDYHLVTTADSGNLEQNRVDSVRARATPHEFVIDGLHTRGRYVFVMFEPDGSYVFTDEIEVLRGGHDPDEVTFHHPARVTRNNARSLLPAAREAAFVRAGLDSLEKLTQSQSGDTNRTIAELRSAFARVSPTDTDSLGEIADRIGLARARQLRALAKRPLIWASTNPMRQLSPFELPEGTVISGADSDHRFNVELWQGEYESAAISLFNASETPLIITTKLTPLRRQEGAMLPSEQTIQMRTPVFVDARSLGRIGDALVKPPRGGIELKPGQTTQLWLTIHNSELAPGRYDFAIDVAYCPAESSAESAHEMIQGTITVHPIRFPAKPTLKTTTWAYIERSDATKNTTEQARADLRAHYVNVDTFFWSSSLPMPRLSPGGQVQFNRALAVSALSRYAGSDLKLFYWGLGRFRLNVPHMPPIMSPEWQQAMRNWLTQWVELLKEEGLGYDEFAMYPFDEMLPVEFYQIARFIKEFDPRIRIYANSRGDGRGVEMGRIAPYIDIWCFRDATYGARISPGEKRIREGGAEVWSYECARPAKGKPPHGYYRLQMWRAFARDDTGCGFWTYTDPGEGNGNAWDDFASAHGRYGVIYSPIGKPTGVDLSGEAIVPSRRWEAWREGVEDYEYLVTLREAIRSARDAEQQARADRAQAALDRAVREVLENPNDPDRAYQARQEITRQILSLRGP